MPSNFSLAIVLGNACMSTPDDVVDALRMAANDIEAAGPEPSDGTIRDANGNHVGGYGFDRPE